MAISPNNKTLNETVRALIVEATGIDETQVIPGNDNHPAPKGLYSTVLILTNIKNGFDAETFRLNADPLKTDLFVRGERIASFSVQFYEDGARDAANELLNGSRSTGKIWLAENGIVIKNASEVRNIDEIVGDKFTERAGLDIDIGYMAVRTTETVNNLASVEIGINYSESSDIDETLTITGA